MPGPCPWGLLAQALPVPFTLTLHSTGSLCMFSLHRPQEGYYAHFEDEERETEVRAGFSYGQGSGGFMPAASCAEGLVPRVAPLTPPPQSQSRVHMRLHPFSSASDTSESPAFSSHSLQAQTGRAERDNAT